ncbi:MAG: response regulator [Candidatus Eremiobacterota bacterium]
MDNDIIRNAKILIVDDQPANLSVLFDYLDDFNARIFVAQSGQRALKFMENETFDIIILDIVMPEMDGFEVCKRLKEREESKNIPVIFMSALADISSILKGFEAGGVDYIIKPARKEEVIARVSTHLKLRYMEQMVREKEKLESLAIMAGGIAHNFNNILMGIIGCADLSLMEIPENSHLAENNRRIINLCERASLITSKILDYSGNGQSSPERKDLNNVVKEISELLKLSVSKNILLTYDFQSEHLPVMIDTGLISQSLINLVINSSESIGDKEGIITVKTGSMACNRDYLAACHIKGEKEGIYAYLAVKDTGCGIEEEFISKIFDPFFTTKFTGRGLGLAAVYGIVKNHKGTIRVESIREKGTEIKLLFPVSGE